MTRALLLSFPVVLLLGCGPPPFVVHVTFSGEVDLESGAAVVYQGVRIGEVDEIALRQDDPGQGALVAVTLHIEDPEVVLRAGDRFLLAELRGVPVVEIVPAPGQSQPLVSGAVVVGEPPLVTKLYDTLGEAIETIGEAAAEAIEDALEEIEREQRLAPESGAP